MGFTIAEDFVERCTIFGGSFKAKKSDRFKNKNGKRRNVLKELYNKHGKLHIKQEAIVLIDELIANSTYDGAKKPKYSHSRIDNYGKNDWEYWKVYIQEQNKTAWEATLNIANTANGEKLLYDIDPIDMVKGAIKSATPSTSPNVTQNNPQSQVQNSDRTTDTTAEILGEKARLEKENSALKVDIVERCTIFGGSFKNGKFSLFYLNKSKATALLQGAKVPMPKMPAIRNDGFVHSIRYKLACQDEFCRCHGITAIQTLVW